MSLGPGSFLSCVNMFGNHNKVGNLRDERKKDHSNVRKDGHATFDKTIDKILGRHGKSRTPKKGKSPGKSEEEAPISPDPHGNSGGEEMSYADVVSDTEEAAAPTGKLSDAAGSSDEAVKSEPNTDVMKQDEEETRRDNISYADVVSDTEKIAPTEKLSDAGGSSGEEVKTQPNANGEKQEEEAESGRTNISYADVVSDTQKIAPTEKLSDAGGSSGEEVKTELNANGEKEEEEPESGRRNISYADVVSDTEKIAPTEKLSDAGGSSGEEVKTELNANGEIEEEEEAAESGRTNISYADVVSDTQKIAPTEKLSDAGGSSGEEVKTELNANGEKEEEEPESGRRNISYADVVSDTEKIAPTEKLSDAGGSSGEEVKTELNANGEIEEEEEAAESGRTNISYADVVSALPDTRGSSDEEVRTDHDHEPNGNGTKQEEAEESGRNKISYAGVVSGTEDTAPTEKLSDAGGSPDEEVRSTEPNANEMKQEEAETGKNNNNISYAGVVSGNENLSDTVPSSDEEVKTEPNAIASGMMGGEAETCYDDANRKLGEEEKRQSSTAEGNSGEGSVTNVEETIARDKMLSGEEGNSGEDENSEPDVVPGSGQIGPMANLPTGDGGKSKSKEEEKSGPNVVSSSFEQMAPAEKLSGANGKSNEEAKNQLTGSGELGKASSGNDEKETRPASATEKYVITDPLSGFQHQGVLHYFFDMFRGKDKWKRGFGYSDRLEGVLETNHTWQAKLSVLCLKLLFLVYEPMKKLGHLLEFVINVFLANGGIIKTFFRILFHRSKLVILKSDHEHYVSLNGAMDPRVTLYTRRPTEANINEADALVFPGTRYGSKFTADVLVMASKIAYENANFVKRVVTQEWKMNFVGFYNCWNEFQKRPNTQVFVFTDRPKDARAIVVAFRGTEPFNTLDWSTDFDFSWFEFRGLGKVHVGFMEALGLGDRTRMETFRKMHKRVHEQRTRRQRTSSVSGLSSDIRGGKILAYDEITKQLKKLTDENPDAKIFVTGHSLGGALATLYTALLFFNKEETLTSRIGAVYTFGQPRVGAEDYSNYLISKIQASRYWRVVYSNDMIPRIPFDDDIFEFKHCGYCFYYDESKTQKTLEEAPNSNYFTLNPRILIRERIGALYDLIISCFSGWIYGSEFQEGWMSIMARSAGLLVPGMCAHMPSNYINAVRLGPPILESKLHDGKTHGGLFSYLLSFLESQSDKYTTTATYHQA